MTQVKEGDPPELEGDFSDQFKSFVTKCLIKDPEERWSAEMLRTHPFVNHRKKT
jgi:serine/threonine-protein kinase 24/25/MST4